MSSAAQVGTLLDAKADLNYYTMLLNQWQAKYEANQQALSKQQTAEENWNEAYDKAYDHTEGDSALKAGGVEYVAKDECNVSKTKAEDYADAKVKNYDEDLSLELAELDIEYDTLKTMYEALTTEEQAYVDSLKQSTATSLQDTHQLQS